MGSEDNQHVGNGPAERHVPALDKAVAILGLCVTAKRALTLGEISRSLNLAKSTAHALCHTLLSHGYLSRRATGFEIGKEVLSLATAYIEQRSIPREFNALWQELSSPPRETVVLSVLSETSAVYAASRNAFRIRSIQFVEGLQVPAHLCASGKAMLAWKPEHELRAMFHGRALVRCTERGPSNFEQLLADLRIVRSSGYSVDQGCLRGDVVSFGAPVFDSIGPVAGIGLVVHAGAAVFSHDVYPRRVKELAMRLTCRLQGRMPE